MTSSSTISTEDRLLASCFQWAWNTYPTTRRLLYHVPNELDRLPRESASNHIRRLSQAKAKGVVPGIPDLVLIWNGRIWAWELKTATGTVSPAQREVHAAWSAQGAPVSIVRTLEDFQQQFTAIVS
jgi:hypothetical protein